jgi:hypothetical protein
LYKNTFRIKIKKEKKVKVRTGFVSNSSTSSFMIVGVKSGSLNLSEKEENNLLNGKYSPIQYCCDNELIGIDVASWSDDGGMEEIDVDVISGYIKDAKDKMMSFVESRNIEQLKIKVYGVIEGC